MRKILKIVGWVSAAVLILVLLTVIALQTAFVQNSIAQRAVTELSDRLDTKVSVEQVRIRIPRSVQISGFYIEDQQQDTLWYSETLTVELDMFGLLRNKLNVHSILLENVTANIHRADPDEHYNFDFIATAFSGEDRYNQQSVNSENKPDSPMAISVGTITLSNIRAHYNDETGGDEAQITLGELLLSFDEIDIENSRFSVSRFKLDDITARVTQSKEQEPVEKEPGEPADVTIDAEHIDFSFIDIEYANTVTGDLIQFDLPSLAVRDVSYSTIDDIAEVSSVRLDRTRLNFKTSSGDNDRPVQGGIDFTDIGISNLSLDIDDIRFAGETGSAKVNLLTFHEQSGFTLERFSADFSVDEQSALINDLTIATGYSNIGGSFTARYPSLDVVRDEPGRVDVNLSLDESFIGFGDMVLMQPELTEQLRLERTDGVTIAASIDGPVNDLAVGRIEGSILESTRLKSYGRIVGLPDVENAVFDLTLEEITTGADDIHRMVAADLLPENIVIPPSIGLSGTFNGSMQEFNTFIDLQTTFGQLVASMDMDIREEYERYSGSVTVSRFDIGRILDQPDQFGEVSLTASIDGSGFDEETIDAYLDARIEHAHIQGYDYNDIEIDGRFRNRHFTGYAGMDDPNLTFRFNGDVQFTDDDPVLAFEFDLKHADLHALHLVEDAFILQTKIGADLTGLSIESVDGSAYIRDLQIIQEQHRYSIDSLVVTAATQPELHQITVESDFLSASYDGNVNLAELPSVLSNHINYYFDLHHLETEEDEPDRYFTFSINLHQPELLFDVVFPGLHDLSPATVEGSYTSTNRNLNLSVDIPSVTYEEYIFDSLRVRIESSRNDIAYDVRTATITIPAMKIYAPEVYGAIQENIISTNIAMHDSEMEKVFAVGSSFESMDTVYILSLIPGELIINYDRWSVPEENYVRFGTDILYVHNLRLARDDTHIFARSRDEDTPAPPVEITISDFNIADIARMVGGDTEGGPEQISMDFAGLLNGNAVLSDVLTELKVNIDLLLSDFVFNQSEVGDIAVRVQQETADRFDLEVDITQHENRGHIAGYILTGDETDEINLSVDIQNINLNSIEGFTLGELKEMDGSLIGDLTITGSTTAPDIQGTITFRDASFLVAQLNSRLQMEDEVISFGRDGIMFSNVAIVDANGNRAVIDGNIFITDFTDYRFALDVRSNNFMLMNTSRKHNELFYGRIMIDSNIRITGDQYQPVINATIGLKEGTNLTVIVPEQDTEVIERAGVVEFVVMDENHQPIREVDDTRDTVRTALQGIDLTANIDVDLQTSFNVIIDEQAGDVLQVRGGGTLSFGIDPSGLISLAGRYEIRQGSYQMTFYEVARRRFEIRPGSNIVWTGHPMDAEVDMTAIYTVRAPSVDLVADQVGDEARQQFRRALPFQVFLNMRGNLMSPEISFELDMPEEQRGAMGGVVYQQLQRVNENETERNKQVFALLVLNRFLPENPFELGEGAGLTGTARTSASKLLTQQLNALSGRYIRGMDIQFDVESYEEFTEAGPAGRTELQLQVSRRFLEDRLIVELGGQFDLEGERARETDISDIAGDVAVEYMLTEDGRFRIRGFRKTEFNALGEGEVIFTGLSFVYAREFNRFMELFRRPVEVEAEAPPEVAGGDEDE